MVQYVRDIDDMKDVKNHITTHHQNERDRLWYSIGK